MKLPGQPYRAASPRPAPTRPLMATARAVASDETMVLTMTPGGLLAPPRSADPLDLLVERMRPVVAHAVDLLQVAARLEADGITDRGARVEYGFDDVFALAEEVYVRLAPGPPPPPPPPALPPAWRSGRRDISHGLLYLMPGALFPAVLAAIGSGPLVTVLVLTGGLGWAWSGGASWLAFQRLGAGDPAGAARGLVRSVLAGLPAAVALGLLLGATGFAPGVGGGPLVALCAGQMAYQLASTLLVFYRREGLLAASLAPAVGAGAAYVVLGATRTPAGWLLPFALGLGTAAVVTALALGLREAGRAGGWPHRAAATRTAGKVGAGNRAGVRTDLPGLCWATGYAALSAAYLLSAQAPYLRDRLDIALTVAPLMAGMGVVEWRARRFVERARAALARTRYPLRFARRIRLMLAGGVAASTGVVVVLAVPLLLGLDRYGLLSPAGVLMAGAHAVLAGAYFLSFLLAGQGRYGALCGALLAAVAVHAYGPRLLGLAAAPGEPLDPLTDTALFLGSAVLLQVLWAVLLARAAAQAWRYR
jgi:hypothetical protein